jgi:succinate-semialdehyde dehydrogenase/glutarate-semialdehyde dehydrogenase
MAGNTALLKHAPISTGVALLVEALFLEAGFPKNVFNTLVIDVDQVEKVIAHPHVAGVTLTGSERAGKSVAALCGQYLKKVVLELGGNDPYLILADADLEKAAKVCVSSRLNNSGQVCVAAKRLIVVESVLAEFSALIQKELDHYSVGDPVDTNVQLGPLAREDLRDLVHEQVLATVKEGAALLQGGEIPEGPGFYYPITVLAGVKPGMTAFKDEIFGPVISIISAKDEVEAIEMANDSRYGLGASVFTRDLARGEKIATDQVRAGMVSVNRLVTSDARLPFGGIKASGFGRELAEAGMLEFMNIKTICID